jgi:hypothetical protein
MTGDSIVGEFELLKFIIVPFALEFLSSCTADILEF